MPTKPSLPLYSATFFVDAFADVSTLETCERHPPPGRIGNFCQVRRIAEVLAKIRGGMPGRAKGRQPRDVAARRHEGKVKQLWWDHYGVGDGVKENQALHQGLGLVEIRNFSRQSLVQFEVKGSAQRFKVL